MKRKSSCLSYTRPWSKKWQSTPVFLPGKSREQRSLAGCSPRGHKELDVTEHTPCAFLTCSAVLISHKEREKRKDNNGIEGKKEGFNFLKSTFMKYNFHTIKFTSFKCTVQWALTNVYSCIKSNRTFFIFDSYIRNLCYVFL